MGKAAAAHSSRKYAELFFNAHIRCVAILGKKASHLRHTKPCIEQPFIVYIYQRALSALTEPHGAESVFAELFRILMLLSLISNEIRLAHFTPRSVGAPWNARPLSMLLRSASDIFPPLYF